MLEAAFLIPAFPIAGFLLVFLFGRKLGEPVAGWLATLAMAGSFVSTLVVFGGLAGLEGEERFFIQKIFTWIPSGTFNVDIGLLVDPLAVTMCLFITGVGTLIHLYSIGYMHGDPNFSKFFLYLNMFAASMLLLVLGDNLLLTFLGWEGVGACSYLLISFWFTDEANASAGKKAFVTNRVGDFGFMLATFVIFTSIGSIRYADILSGADAMTTNAATAATLLFLLAAAGKSAQLPLYVWLPDAMAGPTPVSALIHAATMVTSGVYLLTRLNPVLAEAAQGAVTAIAWLGALTALFAATIAIAQTDIKKVLAYSTVSQLGYLFLAVGTGAYVAAIFHMVTHAFFKALLFLGSGSVIHGLDGEQDMRRMGGLARIMPITAMTFVIGWLAIAGVPPFSGFWSKDEILLYAWNESKLLWLVGIITALLTAFYMTRQVILTFFGRIKFFDAHTDEIEMAFANRVTDSKAALEDAQASVGAAEEGVAKSEADLEKRTEALAKAETAVEETRMAVASSLPANDGHEKLVKAFEKAEKAIPKAGTAMEKAGAKVTDAHQALAHAQTAVAEARELALTAATAANRAPKAPEYVTAFTDGPDVSEFESQMPDSYRQRNEYHPHESPWTMTLPLIVLSFFAAVAGGLNLPFTKDLHFLGHWLEPSLFGNEAHLTDISTATKWGLAVVAIVVGIVAISTAFYVYVSEKVNPESIELDVFAEGWHLDNTYAKVAGGPGHAMFDGAAAFDAKVVDGAVIGTTTLVSRLGGVFAYLQPGFVRSAALGIMLGSAGVLIWFLARLWL